MRALDWIAYQAVNETFAQAAVEEASADGMLLIQDYHFALVPKLVRDPAPHVVTSLLWLIPWPNSEIAGICPWKESILEGMLGADVIGFHTQQYCLNFLDTVQRLGVAPFKEHVYATPIAAGVLVGEDEYA